MHWEASHAAGPAGPGWHQDPLDHARLRWWDGGAWTARIARFEPGSDAISWHADIAALAAPDPLAAPPVPPIGGAPALRAVPVPTMADALADEQSDEDERDDVKRAPAVPLPGTPGTRRGWAILAAAVTLLLVGAGVSAAMLGEDDRPTVGEPTTQFADSSADFRFRYPTEWRVEEPAGSCETVLATEECIRVVFEIGPDVDADEANTLQVRSFNTEEDLELHAWIASLTQEIIDQRANSRLVSAETSRLAEAPAVRAELINTTFSPPTRVVLYEGRTPSGRALSVSLTVRDSRTAPTDGELRRFLTSITSS